AYANRAAVEKTLETRQALPGGETDFERILPGPDRMYPDTDTPPQPVEPDRLERIRRDLPLAPEAWRERYQGLVGGELVDQLIDRDLITLFDQVVRASGAEPRLAAGTLLNARKEVLKKRREPGARGGTEGARLNGAHGVGSKGAGTWTAPQSRCLLGKGITFHREQVDALVRILKAHRRGEIPREEIQRTFSDVLGSGDVGRALEERRARATDEEIRAALRAVLEATAGERPGTPRLVGMVKRRLAGRAGGRDILKVLEAEGVRRDPGS
ncbi:MAG: hypothetical protein ACOC8N_07110, partial [Spirochaetota bacterium]